ncbi:MAG: hypothetical protein ACHQXK_02660 [Methanosarcina thermophila]|jgi:hypothetical protein|uniref:DUF4367 domain-containing protein n=3 Tax=Methanosarcina thermophila TaxID=2210 RepID=A0A1I7ASK9_METTE|nr:hypothetical protein [Methanosarcina thermophila]ALK04414.1 MAG: hypothetical protein AAY43_00225 [Methanosarcina sp. 795]AKB13031.1 hypothetical protein MSTHT_1273 [Methanosarcina thermophila TM-1]AKB16331.1 hypothetical protein MSTHC_2013 [Methanosarcina thermophila CHTI-55]NLU56522.1 hypothetical protein [Methanosarcina thermophila]SFT77920.1 hypothetical protein SAMN02910340_02328 [Methanosarcina thermophila]
MKKSMALISVFVALMIAFSGCVGDNNSADDNRTGQDNPGTGVSPDGTAADISEIENLPAGFEYIGSLPLNETDIKNDYNAENVSGIIGGSEGMYKYNGSDFYLDVIELEDAEAANNLISAYKSSFPPLQNGSRFVEESFNGHSAVRITDYITSGGKSVPRYSYIWSNENYVLVVFGNTADSTQVRQLAEATGY